MPGRATFRNTTLPTFTALGTALLLGACAPAATSGSTAPALAPLQAAPVRPVPKTIRLDQETNGSIVDLRVGDTLELSLPGNPSTGFSWSSDAPLVGSVLEPLGSPEFRPSGSGLGASGEVILRYRAAQPGQFRLSLTYGRPFEALPPIPKPSNSFCSCGEGWGVGLLSRMCSPAPASRSSLPTQQDRRPSPAKE